VQITVVIRTANVWKALEFRIRRAGGPRLVTFDNFPRNKSLAWVLSRGVWGQAETKAKAMDEIDLPKDVQERVERRWAQKFRQQVVASQISQTDPRPPTAPGTQAIRRDERTRRPPPQAA
jgi:adenylate kinase family enzyme